MTAGADVGFEPAAGTGVCWSEVDGVPVAWVPNGRTDRLSASLMFRVGIADEALYFHGLTHLVEHLALYGVGRPPHYMNGATATTITSFVTEGSPTEVVEFFSKLSASLRQLPVERFESEARVIETEMARRSTGLVGEMLWKRYGASGPGLASMNEFAARSMNAGHLQGWVNERMTRQNAVLVLSGPPPVDLRLDLAEGRRYAPPALSAVAKHFPAWFQHEGPGVAFSAVVSRSPALPAFLHAFNKALVRRLRDDLAVAYSPAVGADPYDGYTAHIFGDADVHPEHNQRGLDAIVETFGRLARMGPDPKALEEFRHQYGNVTEDPNDLAGWAMWEARRHLLCMPPQRAADGIAEARAVTANQVRDLAAEAYNSVIYAVPAPCELPLSMAQSLPKYYTGKVLNGHMVNSIGTVQGETSTLTLAPDGLMYTGGDGTRSVLFTDCVATLAWPDGARQLIGRNGSWIRVLPEDWNEPATIVAAVDAATTAVKVPMPPRPGVPAQRAPAQTGTPAPKPDAKSALSSNNRFDLKLVKVTSAGFLSFRRERVIRGYPAHLRQAYWKAQTHNLLLGWWGVPFGLLWNIFALIGNQRAYHRMKDLAIAFEKSEQEPTPDRFGISASRW